ncbi:MAG: ATP-binding protein [Candidatus Omnitrophica bacterium]|nr:ATP-binding protein [Candidatus Omnitrophota bacterium]
MIKRLITNSLQNEINQPEIIILLGPRQVGKTTILKSLFDYAQAQGKKCAFFDLEQPQVLAEFNRSDKDITAMIRNAGQIVFIDEFQYLKNISKIFKGIYDSKAKTKIFCTGSSSLQIHQHLKESLAGRKFLYRIYPLSFEEISQTEVLAELEEYLCFGGMPALTQTVLAERKKQILSELISSYILKDIRSLVKEENIRAFNHLLYLLAERQGSVISIQSLAREVALSAVTISHYLDILEHTYVNYRVYSFSRNLGNELKKSCKTYLYDIGIRNALLKDFSMLSQRPDKGAIEETFVFLKLLYMVGPDIEIKFWRTKGGDEVDFILLKNRNPIPIEVKSQLGKPQIPQGLKKFLLRYPSTPLAYVINENQTAIVQFNQTELKFITFKDFALNFKV